MSDTMSFGILGLARSGKDHFAHGLKTAVSIQGHMPAEVYGLVEPIRESARALGIDRDKHPQLDREFKQDAGYKCRSHDPEWFVDMYRDRLKQTRSRAMIAPDVRYANEFAVFDHLFFLMPDGWEPEAVRAHETEELAQAIRRTIQGRMDEGRRPATFRVGKSLMDTLAQPTEGVESRTIAVVYWPYAEDPRELAEELASTHLNRLIGDPEDG